MVMCDHRLKLWKTMPRRMRRRSTWRGAASQLIGEFLGDRRDRTIVSRPPNACGYRFQQGGRCRFLLYQQVDWPLVQDEGLAEIAEREIARPGVPRQPDL